jgi:hypothetical protein
MTGDTTPISDEAITRLIKAFYEAHGVESWESSAEYRSGAEHHWMREALAETAPLLVSSDSSAQAEWLRRERDRWEDEAKGWERHLIAAEVVVEGLRAELANEVELRKSYQREVAALRTAGGQEKPVCPLTEAGIEHRPHHYLTPVPWDCPGLPAAPVGGQAEPSTQIQTLAAAVAEAQENARAGHAEGRDEDYTRFWHAAAGWLKARIKAIERGEEPHWPDAARVGRPMTRDGWPQAEDVRNPPMPAAEMRARVGGQAEPSDAAKHTIAWTLDANRGCIEGRITCHAGPGDPCHRACRCEDASCYCGGATMEDIDFCNPLAFIENEDDVSLIERYDGADETLRDGPVELVWMPDVETYGWRYAAAAVSGEQR